jgi:hypothetical protein
VAKTTQLQIMALLTLTKQFCEWADQGITTQMMISFSARSMSPLEQSKLTKAFHNILAESVEQSYEVIAGVKKHYLAEGDRVLYEKEDAFITRIVRNGEYLGKRAQPKANSLIAGDIYALRIWMRINLVNMKETKESSDDFDLEAIEKFIDAAAQDDDERVTAASHIITIQYANRTTSEKKESS